MGGEVGIREGVKSLLPSNRRVACPDKEGSVGVEDSIKDLDLHCTDEILQRYAVTFDAITTRIKAYGVGLHGGGPIPFAADMAACIALQEDYFEGKLQQIYSTVLVSALFVTVTIGPVTSPPAEFSACADDDCANDLNFRVSNVLLALSTFSFLLSILSSIHLIRAITRAYTEADIAVVWVQAGNDLQVMVEVLTYIGVIFLILHVMISFVLNFGTVAADTIIIILAGTSVVVGTLWSAMHSLKYCNEAQDHRTKRFMQKYCDKNGRLEPKYLEHLAQHDRSRARAVSLHPLQESQAPPASV